jgi:tetratricopeptide (TPR) repeat protein
MTESRDPNPMIDIPATARCHKTGARWRRRTLTLAGALLLVLLDGGWRGARAEQDEEAKDRRLLAALEAARLAQAETVAGGSRFALERAVPLFREAFRAYGLPAGQGEPAAAVARLRARPAPVRQAVLAALDEWLDLAANPTFPIAEPHRDWLRAVAAAAEPDEGWTKAFRAARAEKDPGKRRAALEKLAESADVRQVPVPALTRLARQLEVVGARASAVGLLRRAQQQYPADFWVNHQLAWALQQAQPPELVEAVRYFTVAVALRPDSPGAHTNLAAALAARGQLDEAIASYRKAIELDPKDVPAHIGLGAALQAKGCLDEAIACYRRAIQLDPKHAAAHHNLGNALYNKGHLDEAIACYRKAIDLNPKDANAHSNLGKALAAKGRLDEAIACYRQALRLDPRDARTHTNLGAALAARGMLDEAIACYRQALALDPKDANASRGLGQALLRKKAEPPPTKERRP